MAILPANSKESITIHNNIELNLISLSFLTSNAPKITFLNNLFHRNLHYKKIRI